MIGKITLLTPKECDEIVEKIKDEPWHEGFSQGEKYKAEIKRNEELYPNDSKIAETILQNLCNKIIQTKDFSKKFLPKHIGAPRFNRCQNGGFYGRHSDSAFMSKPEFRTDVSFTVFLNDPDEYEGGELEIEHQYGAKISVKDPKGLMVFYPTGVMHQVNPVTSGQRICMVAWAQSHISDAKEREILSEITMLTDDMQRTEELSEYHTRLISIKHNLFRKWMDF